MFGFPIFNLEANESGLNHISEMNLRPDVAAYTMTNYKETLHWTIYFFLIFLLILLI